MRDETPIDVYAESYSIVVAKQGIVFRLGMYEVHLVTW